MSGLLLFSVLYFFTPRFTAKEANAPSQSAENQVVTTESILNTAKSLPQFLEGEEGPDDSAFYDYRRSLLDSLEEAGNKISTLLNPNFSFCIDFFIRVLYQSKFSSVAFPKIFTPYCNTIKS